MGATGRGGEQCIALGIKEGSYLARLSWLYSLAVQRCPVWLQPNPLCKISGVCTVEVFAKGGKFLEGPAADQEGNLWVVSINSGAVSKIAPDGKWTDVFNTSGQPQGLKFHKDGRLFGVDRKKGVFVYDVKAQKLSDYVLYFQNQNFLGPNDLILDRQGGLYFTDPWGTSLANLRGAVYYVSPEGKPSRLIEQHGVSEWYCDLRR